MATFTRTVAVFGSMVGETSRTRPCAVTAGSDSSTSATSLLSGCWKKIDL